MKLKIGDLAKLVGCPVVTIRFYEKEGLLNPPERTEGNYRLYDDAAIERVRFILHCRKHGIKLADIRKLLAIKNSGASCQIVHDLVSEHLQEVEKQLISLQKLKEELELLQKNAHCDGKDRCSILESLSHEDNCHYCTQIRLKEKTE